MLVARTAPRILCIGTDTMVLACRCLVLELSGYQAEAVSLPAGYQRLRAGMFDLVIISADLAEEQGAVFAAALPLETAALITDGFISPVALLSAVACELSTRRPHPTRANLTLSSARP